MPEPSPNDPEQLKNLLLVLEHARADAWLRRDRVALEALLTPGFMEINTFGRFSRDELLARLFPHLTLHTFTIEDPLLVVVAPGTAILTYLCFEEITIDTRKKKGNNHVSAVYCWNEKQWRLSLWQITPYAGT